MVKLQLVKTICSLESAVGGLQPAVCKCYAPVMFHICSWTLYLPQPHIVLLSCKVFHWSNDPSHISNPEYRLSPDFFTNSSYNFSSYANAVSSSDGYVSTSDVCQDCLVRPIAGSLIYLMTCTRPDLCYVVMYLSQHLS